MYRKILVLLVYRLSTFMWHIHCVQTYLLKICDNYIYFYLHLFCFVYRLELRAYKSTRLYDTFIVHGYHIYPKKHVFTIYHICWNEWVGNLNTSGKNEDMIFSLNMSPLNVWQVLITVVFGKVWLKLFIYIYNTQRKVIQTLKLFCILCKGQIWYS